jgi:hypothetical protein
MLDLYRDNAEEDWPWFEHALSYVNAKMSHALILSGQWMERQDMIEAGLKSLEWLGRVQTSEDGYFSPVGSEGGYRRGGQMARFDQQPIEAQAMVSACAQAHRLTGEGRWLEEARRAFEWFLGRNDLGLSLYDFNTGGCRDGLHPDRVNANEGAESTLAWLLSLLEFSRFDSPAVEASASTVGEKNARTSSGSIQTLSG